MDTGSAKSAVGYAGTGQCMSLIPENAQIDWKAAARDENSVFVYHA